MNLKKLSEDYMELRDDGHSTRSEMHAFWTDAQLYPKETLYTNGSQEALQRDWQSFGQFLVSQLAAKMTSSLFPLDKPFFRLDSSGQSSRPNVYQNTGEAVDSALAQLERNACSRLQWFGNYAKLQQLVKMLIVLGNALMVFRKDGQVSAYTTRNYSIRRDGTGAVLQIIMKETMAHQSLPAYFREKVSAPATPFQSYDLFTGWRFFNHKFDGATEAPAFVESQECEQITLAESDPMRKALCPAVPLVWELLQGNNYGRGLVEANSGDFSRYSTLSEAVTLYEIEMCRVVNLVAPGSTADIAALNKAQSGQYIQCAPDAVRSQEFGEANKIAELRNELIMIENRLSRSFGYTGNVRDAERVTKEEILQNAREADNITGGQFSLFAHSWHIPLALLLINQTDPATFAKLVTSDDSSLEIVTGIPALSRSSKIRSLLQAAQEANAIATGLATLSQRVSPERIIEMTLIGNGIDPSEVYRTQQELQQMQQANAPINPQNPEQVQNAMQGVLNG